MKIKQYLLIIPLVFNLTKVNAQQNEILDNALDAVKDSAQYVSDLELKMQTELILKEFILAGLETAEEFNTSAGFNQKYGLVIAVPAILASGLLLNYNARTSNRAINALTPSKDQKKAYEALVNEYNYLERDIRYATEDLAETERKIVARFVTTTEPRPPVSEVEARINKLVGASGANERMNKSLTLELGTRRKNLEELIEKRRVLISSMRAPGKIYKTGRFIRGTSKLVVGLIVVTLSVAIIGDAAILFFPDYSHEILVDLKKDIDNLKSTIYADLSVVDSNNSIQPQQ